MGRSEGLSASAAAGEHWFEPLADHLGPAYDRYAHTKGTRQEIDWLMPRLALEPGMRVLDVGCGTGRHVHELARRGIEAHGVDISERFITVANAAAPSGASFERRDARTLADDAALAGRFDAVICLCQGAFGMMTAFDDDLAVLRGIAHAVRPGGVVGMTAFNAYFGVRHHDGADFDAATGVAHERTEIRDPAGTPKEVDLWTGWYTPRELRLLAAVVDLDVEHLFAVEPGRYAETPPSADEPELLMIARRVASQRSDR